MLLVVCRSWRSGNVQRKRRNLRGRRRSLRNLNGHAEVAGVDRDAIAMRPMKDLRCCRSTLCQCWFQFLSLCCRCSCTGCSQPNIDNLSQLFI